MHRLGQADRDNGRREGASYARYISQVGCTPNGHVDERIEVRMISSVKFHGNREWKEAALVGPSLPLIVSPYSSGCLLLLTLSAQTAPFFRPFCFSLSLSLSLFVLSFPFSLSLSFHLSSFLDSSQFSSRELVRTFAAYVLLRNEGATGESSNIRLAHYTGRSTDR